MFLPEMSVAFHRQRAAVLMSKPAAHRGNVHARFNAGRRKEMSEIVMRELWEFQFLARGLQTFTRTFNWNNLVGRLRFFLRLQSCQKFAQSFRHGDGAGSGLGFCAGQRK